MTKLRLDVLLVERGLAESRSKAQALIMAGKVEVNSQVVTKVGTTILSEAVLTIKHDLPYVGRGGLKLAAALDTFAIDPHGAICADVGASTGGFTDVLLQHGASRVYAIDVGYGQLAWSLRQDERVVVMERTNVRYVNVLPDPINLVVIDVSFISLALILPPIITWLSTPAAIIALIKPQFEAGRHQVGKKGVIRDEAVHREVLEKMVVLGSHLGLTLLGLRPSPITGATGNREFLIHWGWQTPQASADALILIENCMLTQDGSSMV